MAQNHPNPLIVSATTYEPPPAHHFLRRPRNVLLDPPDALTSEGCSLDNLVAAFRAATSPPSTCRPRAAASHTVAAISPLGTCRPRAAPRVPSPPGTPSASRPRSGLFVSFVAAGALGVLAALVPGSVGEWFATGGEVTCLSVLPPSWKLIPPAPRAGGVPKGPVTRALIKDIVLKSLSDMGYECPESDLEKFVKAATPVPSRAATPATSASSSRAQSPVKSKGKRRAISSSSGEDSAGSDCTVVGSDEESGSVTNTWDSGSAGRSSRSRTNFDASFSLVQGKNKKAVRKTVKKSKLNNQPEVKVNADDMEVEAAQAPPYAASAAPSQLAQGQAATSAQMVTDGAQSRSGVKPAAPPKAKIPPPIFLRKGANFVKISADCTRLHINYSKAVRVADDGIKMICPNVETFRSLNKYLVDNKVQFHTYALEEERKIKAVIRGIPADFALDDIKTTYVVKAFLCTRCTE
ncbi:hypothetical protein EVAR_98693_1 [Eumeta japonica]|uniref:Uncharacterized protein n=1 Tax=Eumeta variegata TaxID=151549 RepID=A0A4C1XVP3_EUMVA|nr:hypothetical protein EVAR_98693_1 [Eumeta japonica]